MKRALARFFPYISQRPLSSPYTEYQSLLKSVTALEILGFSKIAFNTLTGAVKPDYLH